MLLLRNTTGSDLEIDRIWSCCGCTATLLSDRRVAAGATADVLITLNPWSASGRIRKYLAIYLKGAEQYPHKVYIEADVPRDFVVVPPITHTGTIERGRGGSRTVTVTRMGAGAFPVASLSCDDRLMTVTASGASGAKTGASVSFRIDIRKDAPTGPFMTTVKGVSGGEDPAPFGFLVSGRIAGDIVVAPERVMFPGLTPGDPASRDLRVTSRNGTPFRIVDVSSDSAVVKASWQPSAEPLQRVTLTLETAKAEGNLKATVCVTTDHPEEKTIEVPVLVLFREERTERSPDTFPGTIVEADTPVGGSWASTAQQYRALMTRMPASGMRTVTYPNGETMKEFVFREGKLHGTVKTCVETGALRYTQEYANGREVSFSVVREPSAGEEQ